MLGPSGMTHDKREGDGATPCGTFALTALLLRSRLRFGATAACPVRQLRRDDIWCDASGHRLYNRPARGPLRVSHEKLWRDDHVYDALVVLDYNLCPRKQGRGSAIFFHLTRNPPAPTAGCVAISADTMRRLLPRLGKATKMTIRR